MSRIRKENYKSDLELEVILTLGGVEIPVPDHDFMLVFYTTKKKKYKCIHDGASWIDCKVVDGRLRCFLDNHGLGAGIMHVEYYDYIPDKDFRDGNQLKVVPRELDLELVYGAGDDATEITIEVATDITAAVARANAIAAELEEKAATDYYRGVGVENVEQTTKSYEDGGENIVTITLTDGKQRTFSVFNGNISGNYYSKEQVDNKLESKATLVDGKVPLSQLPDMVDDVLDGRYKDGQFYPAEYNPDLPDYIPDVEPYTPVRGKLYIDTSNNKCYRWDGRAYVELAGNEFYLIDAASYAVIEAAAYGESYNQQALNIICGSIQLALQQGKLLVVEQGETRYVATSSGYDERDGYVSFMLTYMNGSDSFGLSKSRFGNWSVQVNSFGIDNQPTEGSSNAVASGGVKDALDSKQDMLVSGTSIKTINNESLLGSGNISIQGGGGEQVQSDWSESDTTSPAYIKSKPTIPAAQVNADWDASSGVAKILNKPDLSVYATTAALATKQDSLVSGTNIKTVNNESLLGGGNVTIAGGEDGKSAYQSYVETTTDSPVKTEAQWIASLKGEDGVGFASASSPATADGTWQITLTNGDTITINLNHAHPQYLKYELVQSLPASPDSGTLYLIAAE